MKSVNTTLRSIGKITLAAAIAICSATTSKAQHPSAKDYPFIASNENFTYLVGGTPITALLADDAQSNGNNLGFTFPFCGTGYTTFSVASNGWLSLGTATAVSSTTPFSGSGNNNTILSAHTSGNAFPVFLPFWDDLGIGVGTGATASYLLTGTAPNRVFIFEWRNWSWDFHVAPGSLTMQIKLHENGSFQFHYKREADVIASRTDQATTLEWFGASLGFGRSASDYQFLDGTTPTSEPVHAPAIWKNNIDALPKSGQVYSWLAPCTGLTSLEVVAPAEACRGKAFRLAAVAQPLAVGTNCEWSSSADGINWTVMTKNTGVITEVILDAPRWYRVKARCGSTTVTSAPVKVNVAPHYNCYCTSGSTRLTNGTATSSDIGTLSLIEFSHNDTILKNSEYSVATFNQNVYAVRGYTDFRDQYTPVDVYKDSTYTIHASIIDWQTFSPSYITAWLDYNRNGSFDPWEIVMEGRAVLIPQMLAGVLDTFKIPDSAKIGITGMRITTNKQPIALLTGSCGPYLDGETEDYLVNIAYPPCDGAPNAGILQVSDTTMCAGYDYILTDTSYEKTKTNITRFWEQSGDNVAWFEVPNSVNKDTLVRLFTGQPTYYRVKARCNNSMDSVYTNTVFVNVKPSYKCYCYSQSSGGFNDTSDIGAFSIGDFSVDGGGGHLKNPRSWYRRQDYTDMPVYTMYADSVYDFFVYHTMPLAIHADAKVTIFIDFNNNKKYDIPAERIYTGFTSSGNFTRIGNVTIPHDVITDLPTGLRVILNNEVSPNTPSDEACGEYISGETEDFIVMFTRALFPESVGTIANITNVSLYPNPTTGRVNLQFYGAAGEVSVAVTNITGQQVLSEQYNHTGGSFSKELNLQGHAAGIYMVEIANGGQRKVMKLVIQ